MEKEAITSADRVQVFKGPGIAEVLSCAILVLLLFTVAAFLRPEFLKSEEGWPILVGSCIGTAVLYVLCHFQQVLIDGTLVQIRSTATLFRWRRFDVSDIASVRFEPTTHKALVQVFIVSLKPAEDRAWKRLRLVTDKTAGKDEGIDAPVMLAFMRSVTRVHPHIKVENLPSHYRGLLADPSGLVAKEKV